MNAYRLIALALILALTACITPPKLDPQQQTIADDRDVVLTHLHVDHVGGLLADGLRRRLRPDVPIHLAAAEVEFWAAPDFSRNTFAGMPDVLRPPRLVQRFRPRSRRGGPCSSPSLAGAGGGP